MPKIIRPVPDPRDVYDHASRFLATDRYLRILAEDDPLAARLCQQPAMVISAFASELFLKCLLIIERKNPPVSHNLLKLFNLLENEQKAQIALLWKLDQTRRKTDIDQAEQTLGVKIPRDLMTALKDCQDVFPAMRYLYEDPLRPNFYITFFPHHVRDVIDQLTGWQYE